MAENGLGSDSCRGELSVKEPKESKKAPEEKYAPRFTVPLHDRALAAGSTMVIECYVQVILLMLKCFLDSM